MPKDTPIILAIETATSMCSAALLHNGECNQLAEVGNNIHSKVLLGMVQTLLEQAGITASQLDAVAVGQGPGSFTGLRIGVGVGQGIAYGARCPMIGVSSLQALVQSVADEQDGIVLAGIDARMGEIYWAEYEVQAGDVKPNGDMRVSPPSEVSAGAETVTIVGNAWAEYWPDFGEEIRQKSNHRKEISYPEAKHLLALAVEKYNIGDVMNATEFAPIYVRNDVAKKSSKPLPGRRV